MRYIPCILRKDSFYRPQLLPCISTLNLTAQDRSPFCIFHIINQIWQHPELIDASLVGNR